MDNLDKNAIKAIAQKLQESLGRTLTPDEVLVFGQPRSLMAYEMILDHISDPNLTNEALNQYVTSVVNEHNNSKH